MAESRLQARHIRVLGGAIGLGWQSSRVAAVLCAVLIVLQGVLPVFGLYVTKLIVDAVTTGIAAPDKPLALAHAVVLALVAGAVALVSGLLRVAAGVVNDAHVELVADRVYERIHLKSTQVDLEYYDSASYHDALHYAQSVTPSRVASTHRSVVAVLQNLIALAGIAGLLISAHWLIALLLLCASLPGLFVRAKHSERLCNWQRRLTPVQRKSAYYDHVLRSYTHAKELRMLNLGALFMKRFAAIRTQFRAQKLQIGLKRARADLIAQLCGTAAMSAAYVYVVRQAVLGEITLGMMVMYYQAFVRGQSILQEALGGLSDLYEDSLLLFAFYDFLGLQSTVVSPTDPKPLPKPMTAGIEFSDVGFRYPHSSGFALRNISFSVQPGEVVALVGANGSGKTTLVKLLCRLYDPVQGRITVDGLDLRELDLASLRREISVMLQDYLNYEMTAGENIWLGDVQVPVDAARMDSSAKLSGADAVIGRFSNGYDTLLGKTYDAGEELSVGEWQKIALARVFYRDSQIVILDEPTSAMDAAAEHDLYERMGLLASGRTTILISHRFSTVMMADRIFVLDKGTIAESGSHAELMSLGGHYARMFEMQAKNYR